MSNIPTGYKQTEVGVIPEDWEISKLAAVCSMKSGEGITNASIDQFSKYSCYGGNGLRGFTTRFTHDGRYALIGRQGALCGNVLGVEGKFFASEHAIVVTASARTDMRWLTFVLGDLQLNQYSESSAQPGLSVSKILSLEIPLPPTKAEQTAIAAALSDADALIASLKKLIAKKRNIKQGAMQELLKPKEGWVVKKLGEVGSFSKGQGIRKDECMSGTISCVRYGELYTRHNDYVKQYYSFISESVAQTAKKLKPGDILFAGSGETKEEIGKCAAFIDNIEAYAGGDIVILSPANVDSLFLGFYLNTPSVVKQKASKGQGDAVVHISAGNLKDIEIPIPPLSEQTRIAAILSDMDAEIEALEQKLDKYRRIKQGMMQELLTGRTRLVLSVCAKN